MVALKPIIKHHKVVQTGCSITQARIGQERNGSPCCCVTTKHPPLTSQVWHWHDTSLHTFELLWIFEGPCVPFFKYTMSEGNFNNLQTQADHGRNMLSPTGEWKCNFKEIIYDQPSDRQTDRPTHQSITPTMESVTFKKLKYYYLSSNKILKS